MTDEDPEDEERRELKLDIESNEKLRYLMNPDGEIEPAEPPFDGDEDD
jgi:hypothetical protein